MWNIIIACLGNILEGFLCISGGDSMERDGYYISEKCDLWKGSDDWIKVSSGLKRNNKCSCYGF